MQYPSDLRDMEWKKVETFFTQKHKFGKPIIYSNRWGVINTIYYTGILLLLLIFPIHFLLSSARISLIIFALILLAILTGGIAGSMPRMLVSAFPIHKRYRGAALSNNIAQAIFGGAQPVIALCLIEKTNLHLLSLKKTFKKLFRKSLIKFVKNDLYDENPYKNFSRTSHNPKLRFLSCLNSSLKTSIKVKYDIDLTHF